MSSTATQEEKFPIGSLWTSRCFSILLIVVDVEPDNHLETGVPGHTVRLVYYTPDKDSSGHHNTSLFFGTSGSMTNYYDRLV